MKDRKWTVFDFQLEKCNIASQGQGQLNCWTVELREGHANNQHYRDSSEERKAQALIKT